MDAYEQIPPLHVSKATYLHSSEAYHFAYESKVANLVWKEPIIRTSSLGVTIGDGPPVLLLATHFESEGHIIGAIIHMRS